MTTDTSGGNNFFVPVNTTYSEDQEQYLIQITNQNALLGNTLNIREVAVYDLLEILNGQLWYATDATDPTFPANKRADFRQVYTFSDASLTFAHNIANLIQATRIYGTFTDGTFFYPLPYVDAAAATNQVAIKLSATQVIITKGGGAPAITSGVVVLEYLQN
jgi:hypothetical protein